MLLLVRYCWALPFWGRGSRHPWDSPVGEGAWGRSQSAVRLRRPAAALCPSRRVSMLLPVLQSSQGAQHWLVACLVLGIHNAPEIIESENGLGWKGP